MDEAATAGPKAEPSTTVLNVLAVISVKAMMTYVRAIQTNIRKRIYAVFDIWHLTISPIEAALCLIEATRLEKS